MMSYEFHLHSISSHQSIFPNLVSKILSFMPSQDPSLKKILVSF